MIYMYEIVKKKSIKGTFFFQKTVGAVDVGQQFRTLATLSEVLDLIPAPTPSSP